MKATSITQIKNTIIELITQPLLEKINAAGSEIQDYLSSGSIDSATQTIRTLRDWFENKVWETYLTSLVQCKDIVLWLRTLGGRKGFRFVAYNKISVRLPTGKKIRILSPFFVKAAPKKGRKKRGPNKRGVHLLLSVMGFVHKVERELAFRAVQLGVVAPSFDIASKILSQQGIELSPNKIRRLTKELESPDLSTRVQRLLDDKPGCPLSNQRVLIAVDGGRLRQRKNKTGPWPKGNKRCGFHTDWIEPKLFTIHLLDDDGNIVKEVCPFVDGTTGKLKSFLTLLNEYLIHLGIEKASEVVLLGDGAPWIWERIPKLIRNAAGAGLKITEIIDWTHAKQNLNKAFEMLSKKKLESVDFGDFKELLFSGKINKIVENVKSLLKVKASSKIMKKLKSYFVSNKHRMQYEANRSMKLPIGSGVIESAIRRVVNMRVKSPGSFWKLDFAETMIYLRAQLLYGRWENLKIHWNKELANDFKSISVTIQ